LLLWKLKLSSVVIHFTPLNAELNLICCSLTLLGTHRILHVSRIRVKLLFHWLQFPHASPMSFFMNISTKFVNGKNLNIRRKFTKKIEQDTTVAGRCQRPATTRPATTRPATTRPTTLHVRKTRGRYCNFRLLMMGGVSPEIC
jgi:hypothetical protein